MSDTLDITPDTHFLESIRADRGSYTALLAEAVDNSFDAGATEIALTLRKDLVSIQDNGIGITKDREDAIVKLGKHGAMPTTMLGTFGIGLKYHAVSAGDQLDVDSISTDGRMSLVVDWQRVVRNGRWEIKKPSWTPALKSAGTGTRLKISALRWASPTAKDIEIARDQLAQIFYPALASQRAIALNDAPLVILREPEINHVIEDHIRLPSGKGAHVRGGILVDPAKPGGLSRVQVSYKHRVIMPRSSFGCDSYGGLMKLFARVDLSGAWTLARFKNAIADNEAQELEEEVQEILKPILEQCHSAQFNAKIDEMTQKLNDMLPEELVAARPNKKRDQTEMPSVKRDKKRSGDSKDSKETPRGPARTRKVSDTLIIDFDEPLVEEYGYGHFQPGRPGRIVLAQDNPHIRELLNIRDQEIAVRSLYAIAMMIYIHARDIEPGEKMLPFEGEFGLRVWTLTNKQKLAEQVAS